MDNEYSGQNLVLEYTFDVTTADCDMFARLRAGGLLGFLIIAATRSAETLGFGYEFLGKHRLYWVLSRITLEMVRPLKWGDTAVVVTWPKDVDGLLYLRDFEVSDQHGEIVARSTSGWLAIDMDTKRPRKVEDRFSYMFDQMKNKHALNRKPEKLTAVMEGAQYDVRATWFDFDLNRHVTSSRYVDWMMDCLPPEILLPKYPESLSINYMKETMPGDVTRITIANHEDGDCFFEGVHLNGDKSTFRGRIRFCGK